MENPLRIFYGNDCANKIEVLNKELLKIQDHYIDFFKSRKPLFESDEHDFLHNHYYVRLEFPRIIFGIESDSDLPQEIISKCFAAFESIQERK